MVNHKEKGKVVMIRIKEQMVSRLAHRPGESAQTENCRLSSLMHHACLTYFVILCLPLQVASCVLMKVLLGEAGQLVTFLQ